jgi:hypothetical protein
MLQSWDMGQIIKFPSEGRHAEDFYTQKNPTALAGFEPKHCLKICQENSSFSKR